MNRTYYKLNVNGILLPDIYFEYQQAKKALENICKNNIATGGRVVVF